MATEIRVPALGESVTEATIAQWFKSEGEAVSEDEPLVELETEKVTLEVPSPASGVLSSISVKTGETVNVGALLGAIEDAEAKAKAPKEQQAEAKPEPKKEEPKKAEPKAKEAEEKPLSPAVRKLVDEHDIEPSRIEGTGKDGRLTKADVLEHLKTAEAEPEPASQAPAPPPTPAPAKARAPSPADVCALLDHNEIASVEDLLLHVPARRAPDHGPAGSLTRRGSVFRVEGSAVRAGDVPKRIGWAMD